MIRPKAYILDLHGIGIVFKQQCRSMVYSSDNYKPTILGRGEERVTLVYKEIAVQILNIIDGNPVHFMNQVQSLPHLLGFFDDLPQLQPSWPDPSVVQRFRQAVQEFAINLFLIIQQYFGMTNLVEYMLEDITDHYVIIITVERDAGYAESTDW